MRGFTGSKRLLAVLLVFTLAVVIGGCNKDGKQDVLVNPLSRTLMEDSSASTSSGTSDGSSSDGAKVAPAKPDKPAETIPVVKATQSRVEVKKGQRVTSGIAVVNHSRLAGFTGGQWKIDDGDFTAVDKWEFLADGSALWVYPEPVIRSMTITFGASTATNGSYVEVTMEIVLLGDEPEAVIVQPGYCEPRITEFGLQKCTANICGEFPERAAYVDFRSQCVDECFMIREWEGGSSNDSIALNGRLYVPCEAWSQQVKFVCSGYKATAPQTTPACGLGCPLPTVNLFADTRINDNEISVEYGKQVELGWKSTDAVSCKATGGPWTGQKAVKGTEFTPMLFEAMKWTITCQSQCGGLASDWVRVLVEPKPAPVEIEVVINGISYNSNETQKVYSGGWPGDPVLIHAQSDGNSCVVTEGSANAQASGISNPVSYLNFTWDAQGPESYTIRCSHLSSSGHAEVKVQMTPWFSGHYTYRDKNCAKTGTFILMATSFTVGANPDHPVACVLYEQGYDGGKGLVTETAPDVSEVSVAGLTTPEADVAGSIPWIFSHRIAYRGTVDSAARVFYHTCWGGGAPGGSESNVISIAPGPICGDRPAPSPGN